MGHRNFYRLGAFTEPIGDAVWPEIEKQADWSKAHLIYAYRRQEDDEIGWEIPQRGGGRRAESFGHAQFPRQFLDLHRSRSWDVLHRAAAGAVVHADGGLASPGA